MGTKCSVMMNGKHKKTQKNQRATHMRQAATAGVTQQPQQLLFRFRSHSNNRCFLGLHLQILRYRDKTSTPVAISFFHANKSASILVCGCANCNQVLCCRSCCIPVSDSVRLL